MDWDSPYSQRAEELAIRALQEAIHSNVVEEVGLQFFRPHVIQATISLMSRPEVSRLPYPYDELA